jgi:GT2 family glycosyltransferase
VFILDADNAVLPLGIPKLTAALENDLEAAFAYGIIEKFDAQGPVGLESWLDWDPGRLPYGNYVDAMALIRRSALDSVGGYPDQQSLAGWEDYALWLAMAEAGMKGVRLPDFVGRYRVSQYSMLSITGIDHSTAWTTLLRKYPETMQAPG